MILQFKRFTNISLLLVIVFFSLFVVRTFYLYFITNAFNWGYLLSFLIITVLNALSVLLINKINDKIKLVDSYSLIFSFIFLIFINASPIDYYVHFLSTFNVILNFYILVYNIKTLDNYSMIFMGIANGSLVYYYPPILPFAIIIFIALLLIHPKQLKNISLYLIAFFIIIALALQIEYLNKKEINLPSLQIIPLSIKDPIVLTYILIILFYLLIGLFSILSNYYKMISEKRTFFKINVLFLIVFLLNTFLVGYQYTLIYIAFPLSTILGYFFINRQTNSKLITILFWLFIITNLFYGIYYFIN